MAVLGAILGRCSMEVLGAVWKLVQFGGGCSMEALGALWR